MMRKTMLGALALSLGLSACTTSPLGRSQLSLFDSSEIDQQGQKAFDEYRKSHKQATGRDGQYVTCIADAIIKTLPEGQGPSKWTVGVYQDEEPNAFALPGGYVVINTGLMKVAKNQDQIATVVGHEMAHVLANHANERTSTQSLTSTGLGVVQSVTGNNALAQLLGAGAQYGVLLPYSRRQESEADLLGLDLMARAGFDPQASIALWQNMASAGGGQPPEWASTHPNSGERSEALKGRMQSALKLSEEARAAGHTPNCGNIKS
ncbi:Zn-dependent protease [Kushneria pakistanensis]|uniref:Zn-dependent protease n=1 Tax=Kushneria pakistanensis TaxID=1508770 RepID=A0ABQ3F937_9GAMM|nr:M48 family metallopeptidase [Kushneria pakistanensis]GHC14321.1 Zn-dependent protease [Kushneria pakistanensis]